VAIAQAARGGSFAGSASTDGGVSSAYPRSACSGTGAATRRFVREDGADQPHDTGLVWEDADDIGTPLDLLIETFERIGAVQFGAVLGWEG